VPIARYFIFVGATLVALLFIADWCLPTLPAMFADHPLAIDRTVIRIKSGRKWPEKIVLDTSHPTITAPAVEEPPAAQSGRLPPNEAGDQSNPEALTQLTADTQSAGVDHSTSQIKRGVVWSARLKPRITRQPARAKARGNCCQFGWIDNGQTSSNAMSGRHAASSWPMDWPALTWRN
jgi:hypothetical protein